MGESDASQVSASGWVKGIKRLTEGSAQTGNGFDDYPPGIGYDAYLVEAYAFPEAHAVRLMESWAMIHDQRDKIICQAYDTGVKQARIARTMNISRKTVKRVLMNRH